MTTPQPPANPARMAVCRHCAELIVSAVDPHAPAWVHATTGRASCTGTVLPIAEPDTRGRRVVLPGAEDPNQINLFAALAESEARP